MDIKRYPNYLGGKLMPWAEGVVVREPGGFVFLSGTTGIDPDYAGHRLHEDGASDYRVVPGAEAQTRLCLEKIKARLEKMGSRLDLMVKMVFYIAARPDFPDGVGNSPTWLAARKAVNQFFAEYCPEMCWDRNPPNMDLIGVAGLGRRDMLIEIAVTAVLAE